MTTDGYYVEATDPGPFALVPLAVRRLAENTVEPPCPTCSGPIRETVGMVCMTCGTDYGTPSGKLARTADEWQDRHADLAAILRAVLAMCDQAEQDSREFGWPMLATSYVRAVITGTEMPQEAARIARSRPPTPSPPVTDDSPGTDAQKDAQEAGRKPRQDPRSGKSRQLGDPYSWT